MRLTRLVFFIILSLPTIAFSQSDCSLVFSGQVVGGGDPVPGVAILIREIQKGVVSSIEGRFRIDGLCKGVYTVELRFLGYKPLIIDLDLDGNVDRTIQLEEETKKLDEVVIKGTTDNIQNAQNYVTLTEKDLAATAGKSLGESLKEISGVNTIQAGPGIFKPVIHGVHSTRVLILNHGIRQEGQQWGAEHAPEVDPFIASELVVVKDASAIKYGTDALGGVVVVNPPSLPEKAGLGGTINMIGQTNGRGGTVSGMLEGGLKDHDGWGWRLQGTAKRAGDYHAANYQLTNTGSKELDFSGAAGYHGKKFGTEVFFSHFQTELGILKGTAVSSFDDLGEAMLRPVPQYTSPFSYRIEAPRQEVMHNLLKINAHTETDKGDFHFQYGFQDNSRKEFDMRIGSLTDAPALDLKLSTHTFDAEWEFGKENVNSFCFGLNGMIQQNSNVYGTSRIPFIPNFTSVSAGPFFVSKFYLRAWTIDAGARYDYKHYDVAGYDYKNSLFRANTGFQNVSATLGATVVLKNHQSFSMNLSTASRPPHVAELYSLGTHQSAVANEYGLLLDNQTNEVHDINDVDFRIEKAVKWVNTYRYQTDKFELEATAYANFIFNYIYLQPVGITMTLRAPLPAFRYTQTDALFLGIDLSGEWKAAKQLEVVSKASILRASDYTNKDYLVFIPSNRFEAGLRYEVPRWKMFVESRLKYTMKQTRAPRYISPETLIEYEKNDINPFQDDPRNFDFMLAPDGYFLLNAAVGVSVPVNKSKFEFRASGENILNTSYREYTNRFKYFADDVGRNIILSAKFVF